MWSLEYGVEIWRDSGASRHSSVRVLPAPASPAINEIRDRIFPNPGQVAMSKSSRLFLIGHVVVEGICLDGDLTIEAAPGTSITVRAIKRSQVHVGGRLECPHLSKGRVSLSRVERSYLARITTSPRDPAEGTALHTGKYIFNGHSLLPASVISDEDQYTDHLIGDQETPISAPTLGPVPVPGQGQGQKQWQKRYSGVHTPFQHCCWMHVAVWCNEECLTCADAHID